MPHDESIFPREARRDPIAGIALDNASAGLTIRDFFAGMALSGMVGRSGQVQFDVVAKSAYAYADAMMAQRKLPPEKKNKGS